MPSTRQSYYDFIARYSHSQSSQLRIDSELHFQAACIVVVHNVQEREMKFINTLTFATVFAAGTTAYGLAEDAAPDSIVYDEPIYGTYSATAPSAGPVPQAMTPSSPYLLPASPWVANRFNPDRTTNVEESWLFRAEVENIGGSSGSD
jgi:hypothetical protein